MLRASTGGAADRRRRHHHHLALRLARARGLVLSPGRWRLLLLLVAGLLLHSLAAKHTQPMLVGGPGSVTGGIAIRPWQPIQPEDGGEASFGRSLVEQQQEGGEQAGRLTTLASAAADLVNPWGRSKPPAAPPPSPVPEAWLEEGADGEWPRQYRNKTRQVIPNSIYEWKCGEEGVNFTHAAATHTSLLQSTEWRKKYGDNVTLFKWCRQGLPEEVPQLQQVLKLESSKPRPARGLTVVTQLSLERFQMLENQCSTWPLQISAVLYIPLLRGRIFSAEEPYWNKKSLDVGLAESLKFWRSMESSPSSCILDLEVVVEERCERYAAMLYPANAARNRALVNTKTEAMLLVDVDFAVSLSLAQIVQDEASYARLMQMLHGRNAVVLPAFETQDDGEAGRKVALEAVRKGKPYVVNKFQWNIVFGFHVPQYPQGHQATDYWRWIKSHSAYPVQYQIGYEPYIMMHRDYVPFYDERFRGYYWNKVQHLMHISLQNGFSFLVHPTAFVVHVPHKKPSTKWLTRKMGQKEKNHMLFDNALFHMRQMDFVPVTAFPDLCRPEVAPVLPGEEEMRSIAYAKAAAERAAAEAAAALNLAMNPAAAAAAAAKRQAEVEEAERWKAENAEVAAAAKMQNQEAAIREEQAAVQAAQEQMQAAAAAVRAQAAQAAAVAQAVAAAQQQAVAQPEGEQATVQPAGQQQETPQQQPQEQQPPTAQQQPQPQEQQPAAAQQQPQAQEQQPAAAEQQPQPQEQQPAAAQEQPQPQEQQPAAAQQQPQPQEQQPAAAQQQPQAQEQQPAPAQQQPQAQEQQQAAAQQQPQAQEQQPAAAQEQPQPLEQQPAAAADAAAAASAAEQVPQQPAAVEAAATQQAGTAEQASQKPQQAAAAATEQVPQPRAQAGEGGTPEATAAAAGAVPAAAGTQQAQAAATGAAAAAGQSAASAVAAGGNEQPAAGAAAGAAEAAAVEEGPPGENWWDGPDDAPSSGSKAGASNGANVDAASVKGAEVAAEGGNATAAATAAGAAAGAGALEQGGSQSGTGGALAAVGAAAAAAPQQEGAVAEALAQQRRR